MPDVAERLMQLRHELDELKTQAEHQTSGYAAELEAELDIALCQIFARYGTDLITVLSDDGGIKWVTPNSSSLFGWSVGDMVGQPMSAFVHHEDLAYAPWRPGSFREGPTTYRFRLANGLFHWVESRPVTESASERLILATRDINAHYMARSRASEISELFADELERMAHTDSLTLLPNRRSVESVLSKELSRSERNGRPVSVVYFDIDRFKAINDTYGHMRGDEVLKVVGQQMANALRPYDFIGRWGGDEFLVVLPDTDGGHAVSAARRLSTTLSGGRSLDVGPVTISGGVAQYSGEPLDKLVDRADRALYRAKGEGRNRIEVAV